MKILLHMGQVKTGTTALQQSLHAAADTLRERGVCYPRFGHGAIAHHLLMPLCGAGPKMPRWSLSDLGGTEEAVRKAREAWAATCDDIRSNPPDLLILSSELLLGRTDQKEKARLVDILSQLSTDIQPILYVRHPVDLYRSSLQEMLKAETRQKPPVCLHLREMVEGVEATFPQPPVFVAYDKSTLFDGDTVPDFANRFLAPLIGPITLPPQQANRGLSAEALVLMVRLRAEWGDTVEAARRVARLKKHLIDFDQTDPPSSPLTLLPEVAEAALRSATCHRWLAETGRLVIPGLDIDRIDGAAVPDWMMTASPETMFPHDPNRLARLRQSIDRLGPGPVRGLIKNAAEKPKAPRLQDRLLQFLNRKLTTTGRPSPPASTDQLKNGQTAPKPGAKRP